MDAPPSTLEFQERLVSFVRAFGLHQSERTPCGQPLTVSEAHALMEIARSDGLSQAILATRLNLEKSSISRLVGVLETRQWVMRCPDPDDRRAVRLELTAEGARVHTRVATARAEKFTRMLASIPLAERSNVLRALETLTEALHEHQAV